MLNLYAKETKNAFAFLFFITPTFKNGEYEVQSQCGEYI